MHRKIQNTIRQIEDVDGRLYTKEEEIVVIIREYFQKTFTKEWSHNDVEVMNAVECKVTP